MAGQPVDVDLRIAAAGSRRTGPATRPCAARSAWPGPAWCAGGPGTRRRRAGWAVHSGRPRNRANSKITDRFSFTVASPDPGADGGQQELVDQLLLEVLLLLRRCQGSRGVQGAHHCQAHDRSRSTHRFNCHECGRGFQIMDQPSTYSAKLLSAHPASADTWPARRPRSSTQRSSCNRSGHPRWPSRSLIMSGQAEAHAAENRP